MKNYQPETFGDSIADLYDSHYAAETRPTPEKVNLLRALAGSGPVLDIGCGTGQMAVALAQGGLRVHGIDVSPKMIEKAVENDTENLASFTVLDITQKPPVEKHSFAYALFETIIMVGDPHKQEMAFRNIASSLKPGGLFLLEVSLFHLDGFAQYVGSTARVSHIEPGAVVVGFSKYSEADRRLDYQDVVITEQGIRLLPLVLHPRSPSEFDAMAVKSGMKKQAHWSDWSKAKFKSTSSSLLAVYQRS